MSERGDLEIVRACARAMGYGEVEANDGGYFIARMPAPIYDWTSFDPLHDDAQAMALVLKFKMAVEYMPLIGEWAAIANAEPVYDPDIRRAICLAVAHLNCAG